MTTSKQPIEKPCQIKQLEEHTHTRKALKVMQLEEHLENYLLLIRYIICLQCFVGWAAGRASGL